MSDAFQEVEEEYRQQQMAKFWEKYRVPVIGAAAALVLGVAGFQAWSYWNGQKVEQSSREMEAVGDLLRKPGAEKEAADRLAKLAASGTSGYAVLAKLQEAALRAQQGDVKAAIAVYDSVAKSESSPLFRDFAIVRASVFLVELESDDTVKPRLTPVANGSGPWAIQAKELLAYASWRAGKTDEARALYESIEKAEGAPAGNKRRAVEMLALIRTGLQFSDIKGPASSLLLPQPGTTDGPLLLQPPGPAPSSLLGPDPVMPPPSTPTPQ
ncbi:MAG: tetratricopeptide repeat protein [Micropepsaceae bacterium]